jgi:hypothetical protein
MNWDNKEALYRTAVLVDQDMATDLSRSDGQGIEEVCISDEMDGREDEEEVGNVCSEHASVSNEYDRRWEL